MEGPLTLVLQLLLIASAVGLLANRLRIHYNIALVLAGVVVGAAPWLAKATLDPEIVIHVFLPILLFEAAISTDLRRLREYTVFEEAVSDDPEIDAPACGTSEVQGDPATAGIVSSPGSVTIRVPPR